MKKVYHGEIKNNAFLGGVVENCLLYKFFFNESK